MRNIGYLLMKVSKDLRYAMTKKLEEYGLTTAQWAVIKDLDLSDQRGASADRRTSVVLASELGFDKPTMSGIVNRLMEKKLVRKENHPKDGRAFILFLTKQSKELIPVLEGVSERVVEESLLHFTKDEEELFLMLLEKMDKNLNRGER